MRRATAILGLVSCGLAVASIYLWRELGEERARNAELRARLDTSVPRPALARDTDVAGPTPTAPVSPGTLVTATAAAGTESPQHVTGRKEDWEAYQRNLMRDPKYREARRQQQRLAYAPRRANLIRMLGLTPAQADAAIDLQLDQEAAWDEIYQAEVTTDESRMERRARLDALDQAHQDKLRELLGEEKRARLQTYMESRQSRMQVDGLRSELSEANALRDDQVEPLIAALHLERAQFKSDLQGYSDTLSWEGDTSDTWLRYSERQAELMKSMNARMHASASSILTAPQLEALDAQLGREFARFEAQQRVNRIQSKLERANAPATSSN
jgi:hypothetical protein